MERLILGADWSPTGRIVYADTLESGSTGTIWSAAGDGTDRRHVTDAIAHDGALDVSPDGTRILFGTDGTRIAYLGCPPGEGCGNNDIWTMDSNGSRSRLTTDPAFEIGPGWSADGKRITYSHFETVGLRLRMMDASGADDHQVSDVPPGALYADPKPPADEDLDGIRDDWETNPADVDGNGTIDLDLPAMGADPRHEDLFLELDFMPPHRLAHGAVDRMELAFAAAPVPNPDGTTGVTLHVDNGPESTMDPATDATWGSLSGQESLAHQDVLGSVNGSGQYVWTDFDALKTAHFAAARRPVFHYGISAHGHDGTSTGIARDIPSSDFLVTLGAGCTVEPGSDCTGGEMAQAGTLMHELGHNLGLCHGGDDHVKYKPSYLSIMNYAFQLTGLMQADLTQPPRLDYSRFAIGMNEVALNETTGFGVPSGAPAAAFLTLGRCPGGALTAWPLLAQPVDFDCDGDAADFVSADTSGDGARSVFTGHADRPGLIFRGGGIGAAGAGVPVATTPVTEPQLAELRANQAALEAYEPFKPPTGPGPQPTGPAPSPAAPGGPGATAAAPPALSGLRLRPRTFRRGRATTVAYTLSGPGTVRFTVERVRPGRRRGSRCVAPARAPRGRRCNRLTRLRGGLVDVAATGANRLRFRGRIGGRRLPPGRYRLPATPVASDGATGRPVHAAFRIVR